MMLEASKPLRCPCPPQPPTPPPSPQSEPMHSIFCIASVQLSRGRQPYLHSWRQAAFHTGRCSEGTAFPKFAVGQPMVMPRHMHPYACSISSDPRPRAAARMHKWT